MRTKNQTWTIRSSADIGRTIADLRAMRGITQSALAAQCGIPREYLARLERGLSVIVLDRSLRLLRRLGAEVTVTSTGDDGV